jgi:hypothetical protein
MMTYAGLQASDMRTELLGLLVFGASELKQCRLFLFVNALEPLHFILQRLKLRGIDALVLGEHLLVSLPPSIVILGQQPDLVISCRDLGLQ